MFYTHKVALITGGSSGIGLATARLLAAEGAHVWILARDPGRLQEALGEITGCVRSSEQKCGALAVDVTDRGATKEAVQNLIERVGLPHIVINSAGITHPGAVQDLDWEIFHQLMETNYFGTLNVIHSVLPGMIERRAGHIVNIASVAGFIGVFGYSAYCASKFALRGYTDTLRSEMRSFGIRVSIVFPGDTRTPQLAGEAELRPLVTEALSRNGTPHSAEFVARAILRGVEKKRYVILPGADTKLFYYGSSILNSGFYPVLDFMVSRAQMQVQNENRNHHSQ